MTRGRMGSTISGGWVYELGRVLHSTSFFFLVFFLVILLMDVLQIDEQEMDGLVDLLRKSSREEEYLVRRVIETTALRFHHGRVSDLCVQGHWRG